MGSDERFEGWPPAALAWFDDLAANNSREWFHEHRATYDAAVRGPLELLLDEVRDEFGDGIVSRPNRDTRFSKDKTPYKLQIYARLPRADGAVFYVSLRSEGLFVGGGVYLPDRSRLATMRAAIADDRTGAELARIVEALEGQGIELLEDGALKTAPKGYAVDHPRIRLLRLPHLAAGRLHPPGPWLHTRAALDRVVDGWRAVCPLVDWVGDHLG
jgi:uncharacterized protein (TIGR02453 family)